MTHKKTYEVEGTVDIVLSRKPSPKKLTSLVDKAYHLAEGLEALDGEEEVRYDGGQRWSDPSKPGPWSRGDILYKRVHPTLTQATKPTLSFATSPVGDLTAAGIKGWKKDVQEAAKRLLKDIPYAAQAYVEFRVFDFDDDGREDPEVPELSGTVTIKRNGKVKKNPSDNPIDFRKLSRKAGKATKKAASAAATKAKAYKAKRDKEKRELKAFFAEVDRIDAAGGPKNAQERACMDEFFRSARANQKPDTSCMKKKSAKKPAKKKATKKKATKKKATKKPSAKKTTKGFRVVRPPVDFDLIDGTSHQGSLKHSYDEIKKVLGKPTHEEGTVQALQDGAHGESMAEWVVQFDDGTVVTIYDHDAGPLGEPDTWGIEEIYDGGLSKTVATKVLKKFRSEFKDWSIGARSKSDVQKLKRLFKAPTKRKPKKNPSDNKSRKAIMRRAISGK